MVGAQQLLASRGDGVEKVRVLMARVEIEPGVKLTTDMVGFREMPVDAIPEGAVLKEEQYVDRALKVRSYPGQVILAAQLGEKGQFGTSLDLPEGMRLVTVPTNSTQIHSGIMKPGDRVDVVLTYKMDRKGGSPQTLTKTILEYIQVYAMGSQTVGSEATEAGIAAKDVKNVTLMVSPIQGEIVNLALSKGQIHLMLRGVLDKQLVASKGTDEAQLEYLRGELFDHAAIIEPAAETQKTSTPEPAPEPMPTFAEFVRADSEPTVPEAAPETPKWKMEIFQGDERKTFELDLPPPAVIPTATSADASSEVTAKTSFWKSPLATWMTGERRHESKSTALSQ
ncbi:MAG: Flp pilus assembly protein CpaB [Planctomycetales bacterium 12-60-4]|nr:MAG: Flp pilus assembly protein CpaB [Planctomycetales bacterium 12-60-4]